MGTETSEANGTAVRCARKGCEGVRYRLQPGELVSRLPRPGWRRIERPAECSLCGATTTLLLMVRA